MKHRHLRLDVSNRVGLFWNGLRQYARIENISVGGALVRANLPVKVGDFMAIHLEDESWPVAIEMGGEVIRKGHTRLGMPAFAVKFSTIPEMLRGLMRHVMIRRRALPVER